MILSGEEIANEIGRGNITVRPFTSKRLNPASLDLTLGTLVKVYDRFTVNSVPWQDPHDGKYVVPFNSHPHDSKQPLPTKSYTIDPEVGWVLNPGVSYLMHTAESVYTEKYVPILDGKSSIARLFIQVHMTAGFGDPGFDGQYTLEVTSQFPVRVYPGMGICQIRFHRIEGKVTSYQKTGNYRGGLAEGPIESQAHISAFK